MPHALAERGRDWGAFLAEVPEPPLEHEEPGHFAAWHLQAVEGVCGPSWGCAGAVFSPSIPAHASRTLSSRVGCFKAVAFSSFLQGSRFFWC